MTLKAKSLEKSGAPLILDIAKHIRLVGITDEFRLRNVLGANSNFDDRYTVERNAIQGFFRFEE